MKKPAWIFLLLFPAISFAGGNPYRAYLLSQLSLVKTPPRANVYAITPLPKYQLPKGAIFCRMEDKVTRATKVWLKLGVE